MKNRLWEKLPLSSLQVQAEPRALICFLEAKDLLFKLAGSPNILKLNSLCYANKGNFQYPKNLIYSFQHTKPCKSFAIRKELQLATSHLKPNFRDGMMTDWKKCRNLFVRKHLKAAFSCKSRLIYNWSTEHCKGWGMYQELSLTKQNWNRKRSIVDQRSNKERFEVNFAASPIYLHSGWVCQQLSEVPRICQLGTVR